MKRPRLSIAGLMAAVVLIALGLAALANPTTLWASLTFAATVTFLATAILAVIARRGRARTVWAGIALFGWISLAMTFGPIANGNGVTVPPSPAQALGDYIQSFHDAADLRRQQQTDVLVLRSNSGNPEGMIGDASHLDWINLRRIVHFLGAIGFALFGGLIGSWLARRDESSTTIERGPTPG